MARDAVRLVSTGKTKDGKSTGSFYVTTYNKTATSKARSRPVKQPNKKIDVMKFDPRAYNPKTGKVGIHVLFKQEKMK